MIVLNDGTMIYDENTLRDFMEKVGFGCWEMQKDELVDILKGNVETVDDLYDEIADLRAEVSDLEEDLFDRDTEIERLQERIRWFEEIVAKQNSTSSN